MLPEIVIHNSVSIDSRIDWFTPDIGLFYSIAGTWKEDATLAGCDTLLKACAEFSWEESSESHQSNPGTGPLLVVPDSTGRLKCWGNLLNTPYWRAGVSLCSKKTPAEHLNYLRNAGIDIITAGETKVDMKKALRELVLRYNVKTIRVDSGGTLNGVLLRDGLVSEISLLLNPCAVGGSSPRTFFRAEDLKSADGVINLELMHCEKMEKGVIWLRYRVLSGELRDSSASL